MGSVDEVTELHAYDVITGDEDYVGDIPPLCALGHHDTHGWIAISYSDNTNNFFLRFALDLTDIATYMETSTLFVDYPWAYASN